MGVEILWLVLMCFITEKPWDWESQCSDRTCISRTQCSRYVVINLEFSCNSVSDKSLLTDWTKTRLHTQLCPAVSFVEPSYCIIFPNKQYIIMTIKSSRYKSLNVSRCEVAFLFVYHHHLVVHHWSTFYSLFNSFGWWKTVSPCVMCSYFWLYRQELVHKKKLK